MTKDLIQKAHEYVALADKATPGPWISEYRTRRVSEVLSTGHKHLPHICDAAWENAHLIAAAPDMARLLAEMAGKLERTRKALRILANAADPFLADQSQATDERVALVQPVTVKQAEELNVAYKEAREVLDEK